MHNATRETYNRKVKNSFKIKSFSSQHLQELLEVQVDHCFLAVLDLPCLHVPLLVLFVLDCHLNQVRQILQVHQLILEVPVVLVILFVLVIQLGQ